MQFILEVCLWVWDIQLKLFISISVIILVFFSVKFKIIKLDRVSKRWHFVYNFWFCRYGKLWFVHLAIAKLGWLNVQVHINQRLTHWATLLLEEPLVSFSKEGLFCLFVLVLFLLYYHLLEFLNADTNLVAFLKVIFLLEWRKLDFYDFCIIKFASVFFWMSRLLQHFIWYILLFHLKLKLWFLHLLEFILITNNNLIFLLKLLLQILNFKL